MYKCFPGTSVPLLDCGVVFPQDKWTVFISRCFFNTTKIPKQKKYRNEGIGQRTGEELCLAAGVSSNTVTVKLSSWRGGWDGRERERWWIQMNSRYEYFRNTFCCLLSRSLSVLWHFNVSFSWPFFRNIFWWLTWYRESSTLSLSVSLPLSFFSFYSLGWDCLVSHRAPTFTVD